MCLSTFEDTSNFEETIKYMFNGKRGYEEEGAGSASPPLKRQKIVASSSITAVSDGTAARIRQLEQRLQSSEDEVARLQERLQQQEEENNQRLHLQEEETNQRFQLQEEETNQRLQLQEEDTAQRLLTMREGMIRHGPLFNGKTTDVSIIDNLTRLSPLAVHYNANVTNQFIRDIPELLWWQKILQPFLNLEDLSILRCTNTFFQLYWESVLKQNVIRVPQGCPTLEKAMALAVVFSGKKEYTEVNPLKIQMDEGVHEIVGDEEGMMEVTCSHITFVGKGNDQTTIRGGFYVENQQNVKFEELTVTGAGWNGLNLEGSETTVDVLKCTVKECVGTGICVYGGATVTATQCKFMENGGSGVYCHGANTKARLNDCTMHHNGSDGLWALSDAVADLHGKKTDIHSNKRHGIRAHNRGKVNIHLPSQHNTSHGNVREDRLQEWGGSIANINADGTFTHVVVEEEDDDDGN
jgi:hypothetical protein